MKSLRDIYSVLGLSIFLSMPTQVSAIDELTHQHEFHREQEASLAAVTRSKYLPDKADWAGIKRDTAYFLIWQFAAVGVLYVSPDNVSTWDAEDRSSIRVEKWLHNVANPEIDHDDWRINYVLHPYWGATYYTRARERGLNRTDSFLTSALWSSLFEYGGEAFFEPVSIQDMIVTPVAGALLGEFWFAPLRERIRDHSDTADGWDKALMVATDPFYYLNSLLDSVFGVKSSLGFQLQSTKRREPGDLFSRHAQAREGEKIWALTLRAVW